MKKINLLIPALATLALTLISCEKDTAPKPQPTITSGVFILNEGSWGSSNSNLALYDIEKKQVSQGVFKAVNEKKLGALGNDILIFGSKMYIAVLGSKIIFVTDLKGKITKEIKQSNEAGELSPSKLTKFEDKVYVSYTEGFIGQIDTTSFEIKHTEAGATPEGLVAINNKIYVANSTGTQAPTSETISVIDIPTFKKSKTIKVVANPRFLALADDGNIYVISVGDYDKIPGALQKIDIATDATTTIKDINPTKMSIGKDNKLYLLSTTYDAGTSTSTYDVLNTTTDAITKGFITDGTTVPKGYSISADPISGNVYIGESPNYDENGNMYVFSVEGKKLDKFATGGICPAGAYFITK